MEGSRQLEELACGSTCAVYRALVRGEWVVVKVAPVEGSAAHIAAPDRSPAERARYAARAWEFNAFCRRHPNSFTRLLALREERGWPQGEVCRVTVSAPLLTASLLFHMEEGPRLRGAEVVSAFAGVLNCFLLMREEGWLHPDLHIGNVMYRASADSVIQLSWKGRSWSVPSFGRKWFLIDFDGMLRAEGPNETLPEEFARTNSHFWLVHFFFQVLYAGAPPNRELLGNDLLMETLCGDPQTGYLRELLPHSLECATLRIGLEVLCLIFEPEAYARILGARVVPPADPVILDAAIFVVQHFDQPTALCAYLHMVLAH